MRLQFVLDITSNIPAGYAPYGLTVLGDVAIVTAVDADRTVTMFYHQGRFLGYNGATIPPNIAPQVQAATQSQPVFVFDVLDDELSFCGRSVEIQGYFSPAYDPMTGCVFVVMDAGIYQVVE